MALGRRRVRELLLDGVGREQQWRERETDDVWTVAWTPRWKAETVRLESRGALQYVRYVRFAELGRDYELVVDNATASAVDGVG